jgi:nucleotide-binding universal stress UspA family protein
MMQVHFKTILIPIDFSINSEVAVSKALELTDANEVCIYLLHVCKNAALNGQFAGLKPKQERNVGHMLQELQEKIKTRLHTATVYCKVVTAPSVEAAIVNMAKMITPDLIVIGKTSNHSLLTFLNTVVPSVISNKTGTAVLTVKPGCLHQKIKNVVVPVNEQLPLNKMEVIKALCRKSRIHIFLVTFIDEAHVPQNFSASSLLKFYQWLRLSLHCQAEYAVLHGGNKAKAILAFAEQNKADVLLLHSGSETRSGRLGQYISDLLPRHSKVQVLTVCPTS